jgi:hypothetical protein
MFLSSPFFVYSSSRLSDARVLFPSWSFSSPHLTSIIPAYLIYYFFHVLYFVYIIQNFRYVEEFLSYLSRSFPRHILDLCVKYGCTELLMLSVLSKRFAGSGTVCFQQHCYIQLKEFLIIHNSTYKFIFTDKTTGLPRNISF